MTYTLDIDGKKIEYTGFTRYTAGKAVFKHQQIVLTNFQGETEIWLTDASELALSNIRAMFQRMWQEYPDTMIVCDPKKSIVNKE